MKQYNTFLSEQRELLTEKGEDGKFANLSATSIAGLGVGASDVVVSDTGSVNILGRDSYAYDFKNVMDSLPELYHTYDEAQLKQILNNMNTEERKRVKGYINTLKSFKDSQIVGKLQQSLEKHQIEPKTFIPAPSYGDWTNRR